MNVLTNPGWVLGLLFSFAFGSEADDPLFNPRKPLTAEMLVEAVLDRNPGLEAARSATEEANFKVNPAGRLDDPTISYMFAPQTLDGTSLAGGGDRGSSQRVEIGQALPWPGKLSLGAQAMRHEAEAQQAELEDSKLAIAAATKSMYARWLYVHEAQNVNARQQDLLARLKTVAETRYAAGLVGQQDALKAALERIRLEEEALDLERERRSVQAEINALLNRAPSASLPLPVPEPQALTDPDAFSAAAASSHPEIEALNARFKGSRVQADLAGKAFYPDFRVNAAYDSFWDAEEQRWSLGLGFNVPWDRGKYTALKDAAQAAANKQRWRLTDRRARLNAERENARAMAAEAFGRLALYRDQLIPLAQQSARSALADYESGAGAFETVITAEREKLDAELGLARAYKDYLSRMAELERWLGGDLVTQADEQEGQS